MALNKMYQEIKDSKEDKDEDEIELSRSELIAEHERLIKVLKEGSREELLAEAEKQMEDLEEYRGEED